MQPKDKDYLIKAIITEDHNHFKSHILAERYMCVRDGRWGVGQGTDATTPFPFFPLQNLNVQSLLLEYL